MDPGGENWRGDNWFERNEHMLGGRLREWGGAKRQGSGGAAPRNFLEFKRANYPEKQSGTSWQEI